MNFFIDPQCVLIAGSALLAVLIIAFYICTKMFTTPHPVIIRFEEEKYFQNADTDTKEIFPSIEDDPTIELSVIVPAYNEEARLPVMLDECIQHLELQSSKDPVFKYEVIVVSDGSIDKTVNVAQTYSQKYGSNKIRVLELIKNRGKGGAVRLGIQSSRGKYLLFADADGATKFNDLNKLSKELENLASDWETEAIVIGSRAHLEDEAIASRSFFRTILMHGFHLLVRIFGGTQIRDTQCGFKLFTRSAAKTVFSILHVERWAFDVELLFIAQSLNISIEEIAVCWTEIDGSKITPVWSWLQMGRDLFLIWFRYAIGAWTLKKMHTN